MHLCRTKQNIPEFNVTIFCIPDSFSFAAYLFSIRLWMQSLDTISPSNVRNQFFSIHHRNRLSIFISGAGFYFEQTAPFQWIHETNERSITIPEAFSFSYSSFSYFAGPFIFLLSNKKYINLIWTSFILGPECSIGEKTVFLQFETKYLAKIHPYVWIT